ncbi:MAG: hypothetical protein WCY06_10150 [Flavobacteriaceae bacterium]
MKQKFTKKLFFGTILVFLVLFGCRKDDFDTDTNQDNTFVSDEYRINGFYFKNTSVPELGSSPEFSGIIEKLGLKHRFGNHSGKLNGKEIDLGRYDFEIEEESVKEIRMEEYDYVSYTFKIHRAESYGYFENLVVTQDEGVERAYIFSYNPNEEWLEQYELEMEVPFQGSFVAEELELEATGNIDCTELTVVIEVPCSCVGHLPGQNCTCEDVGGEGPKSIKYTYTNCTGGGGGGGTFNGDIGANPGNGGGTGPGNPENPFVITSPVGMDKGSPFKDNCLDLKNKSLDEDYKDKLEELKGKAGTQNVESGYITYSGDPKFSQEYQGDENVEGGSMIEIPLDTSRDDQTGFIHCHLDDPTKENFAVFSLSDLVGFAQIIQNSTAPVSSYTLMVTSAKGTFALKITNKNKFIAMVNALTYNWKTAEWSFKDFYVKKEDSVNNQIEGFLKFFKQNSNQAIKNPGFEFYSCDNNFKNWTKHELDNNNVKKTKKC